MTASLWQQCLNRLQDELPSAEFSMWIRPLQAELSDNTLTLYAPNRFVLDWVRDKYLIRVNGIINELYGVDGPALRFDIGNRPHSVAVAVARAPVQGAAPVNNLQKSWESKAEAKPDPRYEKGNFVFFVTVRNPETGRYHVVQGNVFDQAYEQQLLASIAERMDVTIPELSAAVQGLEHSIGFGALVANDVKELQQA